MVKLNKKHHIRRKGTGKGKLRRNPTGKITKKIYAPNTVGSGSHRWYAEVRLSGWLINHGYFDSEKEAKSWLRKQKRSKMSKSVMREYAITMKRHAYK